MGALSMTWKSYVVVSGAGLLATYLVTPPLRPDAQPPLPSGQGGRSVSAGPGLDIEEEAARLQARRRAAAAFREPARNPFRFGETHAPARRAARAPVRVEPTAGIVPAPPEPPFIVLSGIATDVIDGETERTAILTTPAGVVLVRVGEMVGADYRVRAIHEDAVDLESAGDGAARTLRFSTPR